MSSQASKTRRVETLLRHGCLAAALALLIGAIDGLVSAQRGGVPWPRGLFLGAGVLGLCGVAIGLVQGAVVVLGERWLSDSPVARRWLAWTSREAEEREPVVSFHAWLVSRLSAAPILTLAFAAFALALARIKEESLRDVVLLLGVLGALIGFALLSALLSRWLEPPLRKLDARVRLPLPRSAVARRVVYLWLPAMLVCWPMFLNYGVKLGVLAWPLAAVGFLTTEAALMPLVRGAASWLHRRSPRSVVAVWIATATVVIGCGAGAGVLLAGWSSASRVASSAATLPFAVDVLQNLTDVDRDGISSLFGGRDCAPFDAERSPARPEIPGNGIDEDCDGRDLEGRGLSKLPAFSGWAGRGQAKRFNVVWFIVDSLRPDHLQVYGYRKKTTPFLQQLAASSWLFNEAYSQSSTTALSVPSMLSGRWPGQMQWNPGTFPRAAASERMLPEVLSKRGYDTTLVMNAWVRSRLPELVRGFSSVRVAPEEANWKSGEFVLSNTILAIEQARQKQAPFFVVAHVDDVHHPYTAHRGYAVPSFKNANRELEGYDRGIALFDTLARLVAAHLKNVGLWEDTIFMVTSDHGEEFEEHGGTIHSATCYREVVHVPLIVRVPGFRGQRVRERVALVDLAPTLLELIGIESDALNVDGQSLLVSVTERELVDASRPIFCSIFQLLGGRQPFFTRAVRDGEYTLIHEMLSDRVELYDAERDRGEQHDLSEEPERAEAIAELKALLAQSLTGNLFAVRRK